MHLRASWFRAWRGALASLGLLALAAGLVGCPDDGPTPPGTCDPADPFCIEDAPRLELQPTQSVLEISDSAMEIGDQASRDIKAINSGTGVLTLDAVELTYAPPAGSDDDQGAAFELTPLAVELPFGIEPFGGDRFPQGVNVQLRYTKQSDGEPRTATLTFRSSDIIDPVQVLTVTTDTGVPRLSVTPTPVDFGLATRSDEPVVKTLTMLNTGSRALNVSGFRITKDGRFGVRGAGFDISGAEGFAGVDLDDAIPIPAGESYNLEVTFLPDSPTPAEGELLIFSDDPTSGADGLVVPLVANKSGPCIQVSPRLVDFGGKKVGQESTIQVEVSSCGTEPLTIKQIAIKPGSSPDFALDYSNLPAGWEQGVNLSNTLSVPINESVILGVVFVPDAVNPRDADNVPIPDEGTLIFDSNAFESSVEVEVRGAGAEVECPTPIVRITEGEEVVPQTVLHLDGTQSFAPFGRIERYSWNVDKPDESVSTMVPSYTAAQPVFEVNVVGTYVFKLDVTDEFGNRSGGGECPTAEYTVIVQPDQAIHVELSWVTPGDDDETDSGEGAGSDLDLHFAHANANGPDLDGDGVPDPWFDDDWDVFWYNTHPNWGSFDPHAGDDPSLDRDDTDGGGPENLSLAIPEDNVTYTIGVHYWNDWEFGPADATVKVFHYADLIYEVTRPAMTRLDMWCVGKIHWPAPVVERCAEEGAPEAVTPNYVNTFFQPPVF